MLFIAKKQLLLKKGVIFGLEKVIECSILILNIEISKIKNNQFQ